MKSREKKRIEKVERAERYEKYLEDVKRWDEEAKAKEEKENSRSASELDVAALKSLILTTIYREAREGSMPMFNRQRERTWRKVKWWSFAIIVGLGVYYFFFARNTDFIVSPSRDKMTVFKVTDGKEFRYQMQIVDKRWNLCSIDGTGCSKVFTPFDAKYNDNYRFVFLGNGKTYMISNQRTSVSEVKLIEGSWSFENENEDSGWTDFDSLYDYDDARDDDYH